MQQNHYYNLTTLKWFYNFKNSHFKVFLKQQLFVSFLTIIFSLLFYFFKINTQFFGFIFLITALVSCAFKPIKLKKDLVVTSRIKRLLIINFLVCFIVQFLILFFAVKNNILICCLVFVLNMMLGGLIILSNIICYPIEAIIKKHYIIKAKKKLKSFKNLIIIAVTGSYGKTSTKNYLCEMLKTKYEVLCSPNSYNTPMGVAKTILEYLKPYHQILILEMGADHNNDIYKLCKIVNPNISIITAVGAQHLKTFKTIDNIINTKFQLVLGTQANGFFVTNTSNKICKLYFENSPILSYDVNFENNNDKKQPYAKISEVATNENGMTFNLKIDDKVINFQTKLLGEFNAINISLACIVAKKLGVKLEEIKNVVKNLKPTLHRLSLSKLKNGAVIIDDSFNSNPEGAKFACNVLKSFNKKHKVVITCGMVELGEKQAAENYEFGKLLAEFDEVLIVNKLNYKAINSGILFMGGKSAKCYKNFVDAYSYLTKKLNKNFVVLIENDLTDSYIIE